MIIDHSKSVLIWWLQFIDDSGLVLNMMFACDCNKLDLTDLYCMSEFEFSHFLRNKDRKILVGKNMLPVSQKDLQNEDLKMTHGRVLWQHGRKTCTLWPRTMSFWPYTSITWAQTYAFWLENFFIMVTNLCILARNFYIPAANICIVGCKLWQRGHELLHPDHKFSHLGRITFTSWSQTFAS